MHIYYNLYAKSSQKFVFTYYVYIRQRAALKAHGGSVRGSREPNGYQVAGTLAESHVRFFLCFVIISNTLTGVGI